MIVDKDSPIPQYFQLQTWLIEQIELGIFKTDDRIPTEEAFAEMTGLARATIRQAVQNLVNMGYLSRKRRLGTFVISRSPEEKRSTIIGILIPDIRSGYAPELARGAEDEAARNKHSIILCNTDDLYTRADFHSDRLIENNVSGVIFVPTAATDEKNRRIIEKFLRKKIPVVLADRQIPELEIDSVTTDNIQGGYNVVKHLIRKGHRKIVIIISTLFSTERDRLEGYKKALSEHHISIESSFLMTNNERFTEDHYIEYVRRALSLKSKVTAIFAGHDRIAYLVYSVANDMGIRIPEDISLVGYDDLPFTRMHYYYLTTVHQPIYEMGQESMKLIMSRLRGEIDEFQQIVLDSHLVERESVLSLN